MERTPKNYNIINNEVEVILVFYNLQMGGEKTNNGSVRVQD